jgi:hypothetical protein
VTLEVRQRTRQIRREFARTIGSLDDSQSIAQQPNYLLSTPGLPGARSPGCSWRREMLRTTPVTAQYQPVSLGVTALSMERPHRETRH